MDDRHVRRPWLGFLIGDGFARTQANRIQVRVWLPDGSVREVSHVNRAHEGDVVAFTVRGGTNEIPVKGRHYVSLGHTSVVQTEGDAERRTMIVLKVSDDLPLHVWPKTTVFESLAPLRLGVGDEVAWVQRLGAACVRPVLSGWPELIHDGENVSRYLQLNPEKPKGPDGWFVRRNPRMGLGASADGQTGYLLVVEGRIPTSRGVRLRQMAAIGERHGLAWLTNFDGGGSAFQWVRDEAPSLVAPGSYNTSRTLAGLRPDHFTTAIFP